MSDIFLVRGYQEVTPPYGWDYSLGSTQYLLLYLNFATMYLYYGSPTEPTPIWVGSINFCHLFATSDPLTASHFPTFCVSYCKGGQFIVCRQYSFSNRSLLWDDPKDLNLTNMLEKYCTIRISYTNTEGDTELLNSVFYAYNGSDTITGPSSGRFMAFELVSGDKVYTDRVGAGESGLSRAWDEEYGINGEASALKLSERVATGTHYFYLGICVMALEDGIQTCKLRMEMEYQ